MIFVRWVISMALATGVTLSLFYFMQFLISTGENLDQQSTVTRIVDATMPDIALDVVEDIERPEPLEEMNEPPPDSPDRAPDLNDGPALPMANTNVDLDAGLDIGGASISVTDGEMLPLVNIQPNYPTRAASRGIEGWCLVRFTVDGEGNVLEDTIEVVDEEPSNIFARDSMRAAARFKFQPRVRDGEGVPVPGVQYLFRFQLEDDGRR
ncbi:MAG: TonB family protein [Pseudohongiellaceae bacterium]